MDTTMYNSFHKYCLLHVKKNTKNPYNYSSHKKAVEDRKLANL